MPDSWMMVALVFLQIDKVVDTTAMDQWNMDRLTD